MEDRREGNADVTAATTEFTSTGADAEQASLDWIDRLKTDAEGDDLRHLELLTEHLELAERHADRIRAERGKVFVRLRAQGISNVALKDISGLSDSGISRAAISAGAPRRVDRRKGPVERRTGPADRRSSGAP